MMKRFLRKLWRHRDIIRRLLGETRPRRGWGD
jgi:hypothetical protein